LPNIVIDPNYPVHALRDWVLSCCQKSDLACIYAAWW